MSQIEGVRDIEIVRNDSENEGRRLKKERKNKLFLSSSRGEVV
jgi:hypothetical protein